MITIYSPCWHDDGIVECYSILLTIDREQSTLRAARAKLIDVREALYDACKSFSLPDIDDDAYEGMSSLFDALAFVTEAMRARPGCRSQIQHALRCLERLKVVNHVDQV